MRGELSCTEAYEKLKSYVFYDKSLVYLKQRINEFEISDAGRHLSLLSDAISKNDAEYFEKLFDDINFHILPKTVEFESDKFDFITTQPAEDIWHNVDSNAFLDLPIELHVINILWIGRSLYRLIPVNDEAIFGFVLDRDSELKVSRGKKLFKPYYTRYQAWLTGAAKSSRNLASKNKNFALINLDIKRFFYNVTINIARLREKLSSLQTFNEEIQLIHQINVRIHQIWTRARSAAIAEAGAFSLPLGVLSSGVLANWYLSDFDAKCQTVLGPHYYGRYVDDILITIPLKRRTRFLSKREIISSIFVDSGILIEKNTDNYGIADYSNLEINPEKLKVFIFTGKESLPQINKVFKQLAVDSSEMNLLPDIENVFSKFDDFPYDIQSSELSPKLRDIQAIVSDRFRISKLLSKALGAQRICDLSEAETNRMIRGFQRIFRGRNMLELRSLWFKYMVLLCATNRFRHVEILMVRFHKLLNLLSLQSVDYHEIQESLMREFQTSFAMAVSSNIPFYLRLKAQSAGKFKGIYPDATLFARIFSLQESELVGFRRAFLVDSNLYREPGVFLLASYLDTDKNLYRLSNVDLTSEAFCKFSELGFFPRYMKHWEIYRIIFFKTLLRNKRRPYDHRRVTDISTNILWRLSFRQHFSSDFRDSLLRQYAGDVHKIGDQNSGTPAIDPAGWTFPQEAKHVTLNVAIPNIRLTDGDIKRMLRRRRAVPHAKYAQFHKILNEAVSEKVQLIVFPELSVPQSLLGLLIKFANDFGIGIIAGLEYTFSGRYALNLTAVILPNQNNGFNYSTVFLRLKNHYSPDEKSEITKRYLVPSVRYNTYYLHVWRQIRFTVFNCFELANILDRSQFKGLIDILFTVLFNRDRFYYESIAQAAVRDLHCYVVHANTSIFKGTFIIQPTSSVHMYVAEIKGGINTTFIYEVLDITALRQSQAGLLSNTINGIPFKPLPPNFQQ